MNFWISNRNFIRKIRQSIMYKKVAKEAKLYSSSKREYVSDKFKKEKKKRKFYDMAACIHKFVNKCCIR